MSTNFFKCDLSKAQIEIIIAFLYNEHQLTNKPLSLRKIAEITSLDYVGVLFRHRIWLLESKILLIKDSRFSIDFDAIAELLFDKTSFSIIYKFAFRHLEYSL